MVDCTAKWTANQLRKFDWQSRSDILQRLSINKPDLHRRVLNHMSPDEALGGNNTGIKIQEKVVIVVKNKLRSNKQLTLHAFLRSASEPVQ